jgi:RHS repeat-associated protein
VEGEDTTFYLYNGQGDRIAQIEDGVQTPYILDLNAGLTQVLSDGVNTYLYGNGRIAQDSGEAVSYFLPDGLGSVRTVLGGEEIALVRDYMPYGEVLASSGTGASQYGYAGEWTDASGMQHLRARYYDPSVGRFVSRDIWEGFVTRPQSLNHWIYVEGNPINRTDPRGRCYGQFNFMRNIPVEGDICEHLDQAMFIYKWPGSYASERTLAAAYIGGWAVAHAALVVGAGGLVVAGGQAAIPWLTELYAISKLSQSLPQTCDKVSPWILRPFQRGIQIENQIGRSPALVQNFPVIDKFNNGVATSIKSIDLGAKTYQNAGNLTRTVQSYVTKLSNWQGITRANFSVNQESIISRELILAIPPNATYEQMQILTQIQNWALTLNTPVIMRTMTIP